MIDVTKPKYDPIPLPGSTGFGSAGPRIGEPVPAPPPKVTAGPVLANKPDAPSTPATPPAPTWVKEALGKLFVPTRTKAAVLAAVVALGGGMYAAKLFTGSPEPTATAVLDVNHAEQSSQAPAPVVGTEPNPLVPLTPTPTSTASASVPIPDLTFDKVPVVASPTAADQFRGRDVSAPPVPNVELTRNTMPVPDLTLPVPLATIPQPVGVPTIDIPSPTGTIAGIIRMVDNTTPTVSGPGGGSMVVPAIPGGAESSPTVPMPTFPATTGGTVSGPGGIDVPSLGGGIGGGASAPVTPPAATVPSLVSQPPAPPAVVSPSTTTTATNPTPPAVPSLTGIGGGSIGSGSVPPSPVPAPAPVIGFDSARTPTSLPPVVSAATSSPEPETSFDVDVHPVRAGDSYSAISKSYYGDAAFAEALRAYDESRTGRTAGTVHVPPVWVLRKRYPQAIRGESAVPPAATVPAERTVPVSATGGADWNSSRPTGHSKSFVTPRAMTMREISKDAFGDELYWNRVWDLNLNLSTDAVLPQGTKVNLPTDAKVGQ